MAFPGAVGVFFGHYQATRPRTAPDPGSDMECGGNASAFVFARGERYVTVLAASSESKGARSAASPCLARESKSGGVASALHRQLAAGLLE